MIEFFSTIQGVAETFPIVLAKEKMPSWVYQAREEYKADDKRKSTLMRCPGIMDILTTGYIVVSPYDMEIQVDENNVTTFINPTIEDLLGKPPAQTQMGDSIGRHLPKRPWSNKNILKINTPWHIKSNCKFMMIPLPYTDDFGFEACTGILDPSVSSEINVQGYINGHGIMEIKAGTPLCQLVPITESKHDIDVRDMNERDKRWIEKRKFLNNHSFILNKGLIKRAYKKWIC